jgi:hypothetical protein
VLQGFEEGNVFGDVVVLVSDPLGDAGGLAVRTFNNDANARWAGIAVRATVNVGDQIEHSAPVIKMLQIPRFVKNARGSTNSIFRMVYFCEKHVKGSWIFCFIAQQTRLNSVACAKGFPQKK